MCSPLSRCLMAALLSVSALAGLSREASAQTCVPQYSTTTWELLAGQSIDVGSLTVTNDASNFYVTYTLEGDPAEFSSLALGTVHLWVGNDLLNVPANRNGIPVPGQFPYQASAVGLTSYTFAIPFADLALVDAKSACGTTLYVVAHAEVTAVGLDGAERRETAFGGDTTGTGNRWWFYGGYKIQCLCETVQPRLGLCETAYAYAGAREGGHVWTTDKKSNPEGMPSINLTRNRWGWAIKLDRPGTYTYRLLAGAGLNKADKATEVGQVFVAWSGAEATVTYSMHAGNTVEETHVYASNATPWTIAPGQYGNLATHDAEQVVSLPVLLSPGADGKAWMIAHAVACR